MVEISQDRWARFVEKRYGVRSDGREPSLHLQKIRDNTVTNLELKIFAESSLKMVQVRASRQLLKARQKGLLPNPKE